MAKKAIGLDAHDIDEMYKEKKDGCLTRPLGTYFVHRDENDRYR